MYKDNPLFKEVFRSKDTAFYVHVNASDYHLSRYVAANAQNIYSATGTTKELLSQYMDKIIELCNSEQSIKTIRTDVGTLANGIKARMKYPIDEDCAIRMAAIYHFIEGEEHDKVNDVFTQKKVAMAKQDPELYAFFLNTGIIYTPAWRELESLLTDMDYFREREKILTTFFSHQELK